jgi:hypothetical protein
MSNLVTPLEVKTVVTAVNAFDESFFSTSIQWIEDTIIVGILTQAYYDDLVAKVALLPGTPLSANEQLVYNIVINAEAYAVAFASYEKDLERKTANQGIMENHTQWSKSAAATSAARTLAKIKDREMFYCEKLGNFLIDNFATYPLFDKDVITYEPNFRRFFPL